MRVGRESGGSARTKVLADTRDLSDIYQTSVLYLKNRLDPSSYRGPYSKTFYDYELEWYRFLPASTVCETAQN
jgi:hypothetical protein